MEVLKRIVTCQRRGVFSSNFCSGPCADSAHQTFDYWVSNSRKYPQTFDTITQIQTCIRTRPILNLEHFALFLPDGVVGNVCKIVTYEILSFSLEYSSTCPWKSWWDKRVRRLNKRKSDNRPCARWLLSSIWVWNLRSYTWQLDPHLASNSSFECVLHSAGWIFEYPNQECCP